MPEKTSNNYVYPHKQGPVSDENLRADRLKNPDKYGGLIGYIDSYLERRSEREIIDGIETTLSHIQHEVAEQIHEMTPSDIVAATDYILVRDTEERIDTGDSTDKQLLNLMMTGALEFDGQRVSSGDNPVIQLEHGGNSGAATEGIARLQEYDAQIPNTGNSAAEVLAQEIEESHEKIRVKEPDIQRAIDMIDDIVDAEDAIEYYNLVVKMSNIRDHVSSLVNWSEASLGGSQQLIDALGRLSDSLQGGGDDMSESPFRILDEGIPRSVLKDVYHQDSSVVGSILDKVSPRYMYGVYYMLKDMYDGDTYKMRLTQGGVDPALDSFRRDNPTEFQILTMAEQPVSSSEAHVRRYNLGMFSEAHEVIIKQLGIPAEMFHRFWSATHTKVEHPDRGYIDGVRLRQSLMRVNDLVKNLQMEIGMTGDPDPEESAIDMLYEVNEAFGIVNLDCYDSSDIYMLAQLLNKDDNAIQELQHGDVTVVFKDVYGDHNGGLDGAFDNYRRSNGRTIMFELTRPSDLYRRMIFLRNLGVHPSTVVVAAHGNPGRLSFGDGTSAGSFQATSGERVPLSGNIGTRVDIAQMSLGRLTSGEFMQDSKGMDDGLESKGRKRIIIGACSSDAEFNSAVGNTVAPSVAETVVRTSDQSELDVYGAATVMYESRKGNGDVGFHAPIPNERLASLIGSIPNGRKLSTDGWSIRGRVKKPRAGKYLDIRRRGLRIKRTAAGVVFSGEGAA